jgi:subtilase family serine protease
MHVTVVLRVRDPGALTRFVADVSDPGSPHYRDYLTPAQFGRRFGATGSELRSVLDSLRAHGLRAGSVPPDRLSIPVTATVGQIERAFKVRLERFALTHGRIATVASAPPAVDGQIAPDVQTVVGLNGLAAPHPLILHRALVGASSRPKVSPHVQTGGPQPCAAASSAASQNGAYTADQIASAYGLSGLYAAGDFGQGVTIAEYELEPNDPNDIAAYQACYGTHASVSYVQVDGGPGSAGAGAGEAALDIENAIGLAPQASYLVYQGPNANQSVPGSGPFDVFSAIVNQDRANVISVSWGQCEQLEMSSGAKAEFMLFEQAAAEGQSIVAAAGDNGSEDCNNANNVPNPALAVDDPSSQPFVTGVGGTTMTQLGPPPAQTAWNSGGNPVSLVGATGGAGGGGVSWLWGMPGYQTSAAAALHVLNAGSSASPCGATSGDCRQVPDVAADADPQTGYVIYYNGAGGNLAAGTGWQAVGGTSGAAPVWAALFALADASSACHGSPVGFANPALYKAASSAYGSYFSDVTSGNNDLTGTNGGKFTAGAGYDMTTGLGTPNGAALVPALCADTLRLRDPGAQRSTAGQPVGLQIATTGPVGGQAVYAEAGLPPGLTLSPSTGKNTGVPTKLGTFTVGVVVLDSTLAVRGVAFTWTIEGAPTVSGASITGVRSGRPKLKLTVAAGQGAPGVSAVSVALPGTLRFRHPNATVTGAGGTPLAARARIVSGSLRISLPSAPRQLTLTVAFPALAPNGPAGRRHRRRQVHVTVTDSQGTVSALAVSAR